VLYFLKFAILKMKTNKQQHDITDIFLRIQRIQSINKQTDYALKMQIVCYLDIARKL
jgi:hypothetical protein